MGVGVSNVFDRGAPKASERMSNHALCLCFVCFNMTPDPMHDDSPKAVSSQRHISTADVNWPVEPTWSPRAADSS